MPFGPYDAKNDGHGALVDLVEEAEGIAAEVGPAGDYKATRTAVRKALATAGLIDKLEEAVARVLPVVAIVDETEDQGAPPKPDITSDADVRRAALEAAVAEEADVEIDLDIEYDAEQKVYLWGYLVSRKGGPDSQYFCHGSADATVNPASLSTALITELQDLIQSARADGKVVKLFHYGTTERRHLEALGAVVADVISVSTDLLASVRRRFTSAGGFGLKVLGGVAGATWRTDGLTGKTTYEWLSRSRANDTQAWSELVDYNEDDVRANLALRRYLRGQALSSQR